MSEVILTIGKTTGSVAIGLDPPAFQVSSGIVERGPTGPPPSIWSGSATAYATVDKNAYDIYIVTS